MNTDTFEQKLKEIVEDISEEYFKIDSGIIYHYRNIKALNNIITNNCLWLSNLGCVNDEQEIIYGYDIFEKILVPFRLSNLLEKRRIQNQAKKQEENQEANRLNNLGKERERLSSQDKDRNSQIEDLIAKNYATWFSLERDMLSQWRAYGDFAIGFDSNELIKVCKDVNKFTIKGKSSSCSEKSEQVFKASQEIIDKVQLKRIIYENYPSNFSDFKEKDCIMYQIIEKYLEHLKGNPEISENHIKYLMEKKDQLFYPLLSFFKHYGFHEEKEVRLSFIVEDSQLITCLERENIIIPRVELYFNEPLPIKEIIVSPKLSKEFRKVTIGLEALLTQNGYDPNQVEIKKSSIPYRD